MKKRKKSRFLAFCSHLMSDFRFVFTDYDKVDYYGCYDTTLVALGNGVR